MSQITNTNKDITTDEATSNVQTTNNADLTVKTENNNEEEAQVQEPRVLYNNPNSKFPRIEVPQQNFRINKLPVRPSLDQSLVREIREVFELFSKTERVNPHDMKNGLRLVSKKIKKNKIILNLFLNNSHSIDFHKESPAIYKLIEELCLQYDINGMAISFNQFIDFLNENLGDNTSRPGVNHVFEKMAERKLAEITPESLHKLIAEIEADSKLSLKDIKYMMQRISEPSNDVNITSDEFYYIMTKRPMDVDLITPVTKVTK